MVEQRELTVMALDWNAKLLEVVAQLAANIEGNFTSGCTVAKAAFEKSGRPGGVKQLIAEILSTMIAKLKQARSDGGQDAASE
jgi:hypothetical protein